MKLEADARLLDAVVRKRWRAAFGVALVMVPIAAALLVVEYRLMLIAIILLALPVIAVADAVRLRRQGSAGGWIGLELTPAAAIVRVPDEEASLPYAGMVARVMPDLVVVASGRRAWLVPATATDARRAGEKLAASGATVHYERGGIATVGAFLAGALLLQLLRVAAAGCVVVAIANVGLAATGHGGLYLPGRRAGRRCARSSHGSGRVETPAPPLTLRGRRSFR